MSDQEHDLTAEEAPREERGALIFMIVALAIVALFGAPCCCYFGAGLFQGVNSLRTGQYTNPARSNRPMRRQHPLRQKPARRRAPSPSPSGLP